MSDPKHPKAGDQSIDASDLALVDIMPDHISKLTKLRDGCGKAVGNVLGADPAARKRAGVNEVEVAELGEIWADCQRIDELLPAVEKLCELLHETRLVRGHEVAMKLGEMAHQIRRRAERMPNGTEILAPFSALLDYQFAPAQKAAATREKNRAEGNRSSAPPPPAG
ncbi:hypothetical protein [Polyangium aurulentum]|uniref:hypothetical protein n=1 Tax=Polyangium aurulentum TaxID=2567896 RepID=UPI0010ADBB77|nr:hypothetical protein [Polyangium aurulentum]UQA57268.1 hypothetical protein E8A73_039215 [Polyangium aurulentum]